MVFQPCTYILASKKNGTLYAGVTRDIAMRVWMHRQGRASKFTAKYNVHMLVWLEFSPMMVDAIACEKRIKNWRRQWKLELIESVNPNWNDIYPTLNH